MGEEAMLEDRELELEDLDEEPEQDVEPEPGEENAVPDTDMDRESGAGDSLYERSVQKGSQLVETLKGKADTAMETLLPRAERLIDKHKGRFFQAYDQVMDLKDEMHYASKDSGGGWAGLKSAAGVLGRHVKESDTYKKFMSSKVGRGLQATGQGISWMGGKVKSGASYLGDKVKSGASYVADKFNGTRLGRWIQEKRASQSDEPGFFSKAWDKVKSGASYLGDKVKSGASYVGDKMKSGASYVADKFNGTRLGRWIQEKRASQSDEPGFFSKAWDKVKSGASYLGDKVKSGASYVGGKVKSGASYVGDKVKSGAAYLADKVKDSEAVKWTGAQIDRAKAWAGEQKDWVDSKMSALKAWKGVHIDEVLDNHEHERRVRFMERQGDSGYGQRYDDMVGELSALPGIERLKGMVNGADIEEILLELEQGKETVDEKVGAAAEKGKGVAKATSTLLKVPFLPDGAKDISSKMELGGEVLDGVKSAAGIVTAKRLSKDLSAMQEKTSDRTLSKGLRFAKAKADKDVVDNSFKTVKTAVTVAGKVFGQKTAAKVVDKVVDLAEGAVTSGMDKETRKDSLKGLLGGVEGYRQLKAKYKLKAPEMRRAIRQAIGVSSEDDVVNMDRMATSTDIMKNAKEGDQDAMAFASRVKSGSNASLYRAMGGGDTIFTTQNYAT